MVLKRMIGEKCGCWRDCQTVGLREECVQPVGSSWRMTLKQRHRGKDDHMRLARRRWRWSWWRWRWQGLWLHFLFIYEDSSSLWEVRRIDISMRLHTFNDNGSIIIIAVVAGGYIRLWGDFPRVTHLSCHKRVFVQLRIASTYWIGGIYYLYVGIAEGRYHSGREGR